MKHRYYFLLLLTALCCLCCGEAYSQSRGGFPYKIDTSDLCYKLFIQRGFEWGGDWTTVKDYQHFEKR